jgi:hypothetical protein
MSDTREEVQAAGISTNLPGWEQGRYVSPIEPEERQPVRTMDSRDGRVSIPSSSHIETIRVRIIPGPERDADVSTSVRTVGV